MTRKLAKWHEDRCEVGEYRRDGTGSHFKRAKICVDGKEGCIYGVGTTFEEADAALKTFTNHQCVCFPGQKNDCKIHPSVQSGEDQFVGPTLMCFFTEFESDYVRWPSSGYKENGELDYDIITAWGHRA
jgi:hypothetical protein